MATDIDLSADIEGAIELLYKVRKEFYFTDLRAVALNDALAPLFGAAEGLRALVPQITKDADAYYFVGDLSYEVDLEEMYEGKALLLAWLFSNVHSLRAGGGFSSYENSLNSLSDNLLDLCSWCTGWDADHGCFPSVAA